MSGWFECTRSRSVCLCPFVTKDPELTFPPVSMDIRGSRWSYRTGTSGIRLLTSVGAESDSRGDLGAPTLDAVHSGVGWKSPTTGVLLRACGCLLPDRRSNEKYLNKYFNLHQRPNLFLITFSLTGTTT